MESVARRLWQLLEPVHLVTYRSDEPTEALQALGYRGYWAGYFAARSAPLGRVLAEVVDALFYNFAPRQVARYLPAAWEVATPEAALAARQEGSVASLRQILGELADTPAVARAADLATRAATGAPMEGRILYAALRSLPVPHEPVARLWHAATLLREHRGDGHVAALVTAGIGGQEAHVLHAATMGQQPHEFGRLHALTPDQLAAVVEGMRARGLIDADGTHTEAGRETKDRIESVTDTLAAPAYDCLDSSEVDQLVADLEPLVAAIDAAGY